MTQAIPEDLPVPVDDGAANHLPGTPMPPVALECTGTAEPFQLDRVPPGYRRLIIYVFPKIADPAVGPPPGWDEIPGARGCTAESCALRDHAADLAEYGAAVVGVSTSDISHQRAAVERLRLPFPLCSDRDGVLTGALRLPTFTAAGKTLLKRLTLVIGAGDGGQPRIEHVFYPVYPPDGHAEQILAWLSTVDKPRS